MIVEEPQPEGQQPEAEEAMAENVAEPVRLGRSRSARTAESAPVSRDVDRDVNEGAPPKDVAQYVFVRRDGGLIFAVGYSWDKQTLRYVTPDGIRRNIARDALDLKATEEFNEQRGLNFNFPA